MSVASLEVVLELVTSAAPGSEVLLHDNDSRAGAAFDPLQFGLFARPGGAGHMAESGNPYVGRVNCSIDAINAFNFVPPVLGSSM